MPRLRHQGKPKKQAPSSLVALSSWVLSSQILSLRPWGERVVLVLEQEEKTASIFWQVKADSEHPVAIRAFCLEILWVASVVVGELGARKQ